MIDGDLSSDPIFLPYLRSVMLRNPVMFDAIKSLMVGMQTDMDMLVDEMAHLHLVLLAPKARLYVDEEPPSLSEYLRGSDSTIVIFFYHILLLQMI